MTLIKFVLDNFFSTITKFGTPFFYAIIFLYILKLDSAFALIFFITFTIIEVLGFIIKLAYHKPRPKPKSYKNWWEKYDAGSFPSMHTTRIFTLAILLSNYFHELYFTIINFIFAITVAYSRIYRKRHFPTDLIAGVIMAFTVTTIILTVLS